MTPTDELRKAEQRGYSRGYAAGLRFGKHNPTTPLPLDLAVDTRVVEDLALADDVKNALLRGFERGFPIGVKFGQFKAARQKARQPPAPSSPAPEQIARPFSSRPDAPAGASVQ